MSGELISTSRRRIMLSLLSWSCVSFRWRCDRDLKVLVLSYTENLFCSGACERQRYSRFNRVCNCVYLEGNMTADNEIEIREAFQRAQKGHNNKAKLVASLKSRYNKVRSALESQLTSADQLGSMYSMTTLQCFYFLKWNIWNNEMLKNILNKHSSHPSAGGQDTVPWGVCPLLEVRHDRLQARTCCRKCHGVCCKVFHVFPICTKSRGRGAAGGCGGGRRRRGRSSIFELHLQLLVGGKILKNMISFYKGSQADTVTFEIVTFVAAFI